MFKFVRKTKNISDTTKKDNKKYAFFENGILKNVYPRNEMLTLYDDRQTAYDAAIIVSDGREYDITTVSGIDDLPIPNFELTDSVCFDLSYIIKMRCCSSRNAELIPAFVKKTIDLMQASKILWRQKDYNRIVQCFYDCGLTDEGHQFVTQYCAAHPELFENMDYLLKQNAQKVSLQLGESLGYNAVQISAVHYSSPEHEPLQGKIFLKSEFDKMQSGKPFVDIDGNYYTPIRNPIGEGNCDHFAISFSTQHSVSRYKESDLQQWAAENAAGCIIDGKHYTMWETKQLMNEIITEIREQREIAIKPMSEEKDDIRYECQLKINELSGKYNQIVKISGLRSRMTDSYVYGFKPYRLT